MPTFPGLAGLLTDAREFLAAVRFARPELLWLLLLLPVLALVNRYAAARRRRATADIGRPAAVAGLQTHPRPRPAVARAGVPARLGRAGARSSPGRGGARATSRALPSAATS